MAKVINNIESNLKTGCPACKIDATTNRAHPVRWHTTPAVSMARFCRILKGGASCSSRFATAFHGKYHNKSKKLKLDAFSRIILQMTAFSSNETRTNILSGTRSKKKKIRKNLERTKKQPQPSNIK